jgi:hypothetical protein
VRFLVDPNVSGQSILRNLSAPYDILFLVDMPSGPRTADEIATYACSDARILITNNIEYYRSSYERIVHHPGIVELETKYSASNAGRALLAFLSKMAEAYKLNIYDALRDSVITIIIDQNGNPHFDFFDRFP